MLEVSTASSSENPAVVIEHKTKLIQDLTETCKFKLH